MLKNKYITMLFELMLVSVLLYKSLNLIKIFNASFIIEGTKEEYNNILFDISITIILFTIFFIYSLTKKYYLYKNDNLKDIHKLNKTSQVIVHTTLFTSFLILVTLYFINNYIIPENMIDIFKDIRFYLTDMIIILVLGFIFKYEKINLIKKVMMTKAIFIWFLYMILLSYINIINDLGLKTISNCMGSNYETKNIIFIKNKNCKENLNNNYNYRENISFITLTDVLKDKKISKSERAKTLKYFYKQNENFRYKSWLEENKPEIYKDAYGLKIKEKLLENSESDQYILDFIIAGDTIKMNDYKEKYKKDSLAMIIIKN